MPRDIVTLVNRTSKNLGYRYDGVDEVLVPGPNHGMPRKHVEFAKNQNKRMGTENFYDPNDVVYLVGIEGKDDCTPLEQSNALQIIDREDKNERDGQVSEPRRAPGPTPFDAKMPGGDGIASGDTAFSGNNTQGDGRPAGGRTPAARGTSRRRR